MSDRGVALGLFAPVLLALVFSYARLLTAPMHVPRDEDYPAARGVLEAQGYARERDALAILPAWSLRPLTALGDLAPISGDALVEQPLQRYARLFVVLEPDAEDAHDALIARLGEPAFRERVGRVTVERFDLPSPSVRFDFRARLAEARVSIDGKPCTQPAPGGVSCGGEWWRRVTREWLLVSENADDAVWSHPPPRGQRLEIEWPAVPLSDAIVVRAGFTRDGADQAKAPVRLTVWVDEQEVGRVERAPAFAFTTTEIDTRAFAGRDARVRFIVETDDNAGAKIAWDATAVGAVP